jgi:hypothetical protein
VQSVPLIPLDRVLAVAKALHAPVVVKIDAEGSECEMVSETPPESWIGFREVLIEHHRFAPCAAEGIIDRLSMRLIASDDLLHFRQ